MRKTVLVCIGILALFSGCPNGTPGDVGSLILSFSTADMLARTFVPDLDMNVASYDVSGIGPDSSTFSQPGVTETSVVQNSLAVGAWTIVVEAYNGEDILIGSGSTAVEIRAGKTTTATVTVTPLDGKGTLSVNVSWTPGLITNPSAVATLTPVGGSAQNLSFVPGTNSLSYNSGKTLDMGYYWLQIQLLDDGVPTWWALEAVRILKDQTTTGTFALDEDDINTGGVSITIVPALQNPITITFSGHVSFLTPGTDMTVTASTSESGVSYQWYLNGQLLSGETAPSITIGSTLANGNYRLDLAVAKGSVISSNHVRFTVGEYHYEEALIDAGGSPPMIDSVVLGIGRNDGVLRLYSTGDWLTNKGYEYRYSGSEWISENIFTATAYCSAPTVVDLVDEGSNTLYLGGWSNLGVLMMKFSGGWPAYSILPGSEGKGSILAMLAGNGRNDGVTRLYVSHGSTSGLVEYSWNSGTSMFDAVQLLNVAVGRIGIGKGRNDGINRIYVVERGGTSVHELTWNGSAFDDTVIFTGSAVSNGSAHVADGRGDGVQRVYVWAGGLFELTWQGGTWVSRTLDADILERYYINAGSIRHDGEPGVYVSVKNQGLYEYVWSESGATYQVDAISAATGGCSIGNGRGDGKNRLYVARGTKGHYVDAAVIEIWEEP